MPPSDAMINPASNNLGLIVQHKDVLPLTQANANPPNTSKSAYLAGVWRATSNWIGMIYFDIRSITRPDTETLNCADG